MSNKFIIKLIIALCLLTLPLYANGWQNPSERYANAYKDYLNTALSVQNDGIKHFVYFARDRKASQCLWERI